MFTPNKSLKPTPGVEFCDKGFGSLKAVGGAVVGGAA